jgi:hypothetical protein
VRRRSGWCGVVRRADSSSSDACVLDDRNVGNYELCYIWRCGNDTISGVDIPTMVQRHFHRRDTAGDHYLRPNPPCAGTRRSARNQPAVPVLITFCWLLISSDCIASVAIRSGALTIDRQLGADEASGPVSHSHSLWERVEVRVNRRLVISSSVPDTSRLMWMDLRWSVLVRLRRASATAPQSLGGTRGIGRRRMRWLVLTPLSE